MVEHPSAADFEHFVGGRAVGGDFERHVSGCDACSCVLAREAQVQLVAEAAAHELRARREWLSGWRGPGYLMGAALALAASLFLIFQTVSAQASTRVEQRNANDVNGQPFAIAVPDAGYEGPFLAVRDAGPWRPGLCAGCEQHL
jgi:protein involved in temperature-dependent protein secretion